MKHLQNTQKVLDNIHPIETKNALSKTKTVNPETKFQNQNRKHAQNFGKKIPKYLNDSQKNNGRRNLRGSDMKTKLCKNHIRIVSKADMGKGLCKIKTKSISQTVIPGIYWNEITRQTVEINDAGN